MKISLGMVAKAEKRTVTTREQLLLGYGIVALGLLTAQVSVGRFGTRYVLVFLLSSIVFGLGVFGLLRLLRKAARSDKTSKGVQEFEREVRSLSIQEAKRRVQVFLSDHEKFRCEAARSSSERLNQVAPALQELFRQYETIETARGELKLSSQEMGPSKVKKGYIKIGSNAEFVEVTVRPGEEAVYELDDTVPKDWKPQEGDSFPSIYHYLLMETKLLFES